jgi:hypothetical protein
VYKVQYRTMDTSKFALRDNGVVNGSGVGKLSASLTLSMQLAANTN